jgi:hypothetical protein
MNLFRKVTLAAAWALIACDARAASDASASGYQPLAFLIGHCWKGTFPDSHVTDEHCFSWVYGGKFVRDRHVLRPGAGKSDALGESIYLWDATAKELQYLYIESAGGFSRGTVSADGDALIFPPTPYQENGESRIYRSRWQRSGEHAYDVITEFQVKGVWTPGFTLHMQQVKP